MSTRAPWLVAALILLVPLGCADELTTNRLVSARAVFNARLTADKGPAAGLPTPRFYSDGGFRNQEIVSELYHSMIPSTSQFFARRHKRSNVQRKLCV